MIDVDKEVYVGPYRCDIVAKDETSGIRVIVENQLETTNHDHLGKIITYTSGLGAKIMVWIVKEAKEEHRAAVEWLNNNTGNDVNFFLIEIHSYRIGDSIPAPKFEVVEKPNVFVKRGKPRRHGVGDMGTLLLGRHGDAAFVLGETWGRCFCLGWIIITVKIIKDKSNVRNH